MNNDNNDNMFNNQDVNNQDSFNNNSANDILNNEMNLFFQKPMDEPVNQESIETLDTLDTNAQDVPKVEPINPESYVNNNEITDINPTNYTNIFKENVKPQDVFNQQTIQANNVPNNPNQLQMDETTTSSQQEPIKVGSYNDYVKEKVVYDYGKTGPFGIQFSAYLFLLISVAQYFLLAPFIETIFQARALKHSMKALIATAGGDSSPFHELLFYLFEALLLFWILFSVFLVIYSFINLFRKNQSSEKIKEHVKIGAISFLGVSIVLVLLLKVADINLISKLIETFTLDGFQLKIVPFKFTEFLLDI